MGWEFAIRGRDNGKIDPILQPRDDTTNSFGVVSPECIPIDGGFDAMVSRCNGQQRVSDRDSVLPGLEPMVENQRVENRFVADRPIVNHRVAILTGAGT